MLRLLLETVLRLELLRYRALGKTECWYILDCDKDAKIVIGHSANSKEELRQMIENKEWDKLQETSCVTVAFGNCVTVGATEVSCCGQRITSILFSICIYDYEYIRRRRNS